MILFFLVILSCPIFGRTNIDSIFSIQFPTNPERQDYEVENEKGTVFYFNSENESFFAMRIIDTNVKYKIVDLNDLKTLYENIITVQINAMKRKNFVFIDTTEIYIDGFIAYKISYQDLHSKNQNAESIVMFLNGITYVATYSKVKEFLIENKEKFLKSIKIDKSRELKQFEQPYDFKGKLLELFISVIFLLTIFYLLKKYKKTTGNK
jgi:hypothetical protein